MLVQNSKTSAWPEQVINLVDCRDDTQVLIWQYDIDADETYTLALSWSDNQKVKEIEYIRPAHWQTGTSRDSDYWSKTSRMWQPTSSIVQPLCRAGL